MRAVLKIYNVDDRIVWVADSFEGLPKPDSTKYPKDNGIKLDKVKELAVSIEEVKRNFNRYDLLDDQVRFLKGWFNQTLPEAPIDQLALMRLDGDMYESTMDGLTCLYPKLSVGGYVIIDDYGALIQSREAVDDFRTANRIDDELVKIDYTGVYWRRSK